MEQPLITVQADLAIVEHCDVFCRAFVRCRTKKCPTRQNQQNEEICLRNKCQNDSARPN